MRLYLLYWSHPNGKSGTEMIRGRDLYEAILIAKMNWEECEWHG